jgi:hypothetical protein
VIREEPDLALPIPLIGRDRTLIWLWTCPSPVIRAEPDLVLPISDRT